MIFTEKQLVEFCNWKISISNRYITMAMVSDSDLRNFFGSDYDNIKKERKEKLKKIYGKTHL